MASGTSSGARGTVFGPRDHWIGTGPACHDERLDPARRYALSRSAGSWHVHDLAHPEQAPQRTRWQWDVVLAMFGRAELLVVPDGERVLLVNAEEEVLRAWTVPAGCGAASQAQFAADSQLIWLYFGETRSLCALVPRTDEILGPLHPGGREDLGALWVHPRRPVVVLDTFTPQDVSAVIVVEVHESQLRIGGHGYAPGDMGEFIGFDATGDLGTFIDGHTVHRWSLATGRSGGECAASELFGVDGAIFASRGTSFHGRVSVLWSHDETQRACVLTDALELECGFDVSDPQDEACGAELVAYGILRVPFVDVTSYYRLPERT